MASKLDTPKFTNLIYWNACRTSHTPCWARRAPALLPAKLRPHVGTAAAADLTDKPVLDVGQPDIVAPAVGVRFDVMGAAMIAAVDQLIAYAGGAHLAEGDFGGLEGVMTTTVPRDNVLRDNCP